MRKCVWISRVIVTVPLQAYTYHINVISLQYTRMSQIMAQTNGERKFQGANIPGSENPWVRKFPGHFAPGSESSRELEGQGAKGPVSELARVLLADSLLGANGSEKVVNPIFTALHGMQTRSCGEISVRPSVKRMHCDKMEEKSVQIFIPCNR